MAKKKKKSLKPKVMDAACFVGGVVLGELIAFLVRDIGFLKWLSFEVSGTLDLVLVSISIHLNPAVVLFPLMAVVAGRMIHQSLSEPKERSRNVQQEPSEDEEDEQYYDA